VVGSQRLLALISAHYGTRYLKVLNCAADVWQRLRDVSAEKEQENRPQIFMPGPTIDLLAIEVHVQQRYRPGQWEMIRHDNCRVVDADDPERATVTHEECTVIDRNPGE
jgi:hypothetical protein